MYGAERTPAWQRDVMWVAGTVAVIATIVATAALAWARASDADSGPAVLTPLLRATLLPGDGDETAALAVRGDDGLRPGEPVEILPGSGVLVDPTELPAFSVDDALARAAGVWSERLLSDGRSALVDGLGEAVLQAQVRRTVDGPATDLIEGELAEELLPAGLGDGSRMANWPLQAQRAPGEPVQPIVGIFVTIDPIELEGLSPGQIGEAVIRLLAEEVVASGADAVRDVISNVNLAARFEQGLAQSRDATHTLFEALLAGRAPEIAARLDEARAVQQGVAEPDPGLAGLLADVDVAGLPTDAANDRVLEAIATAVHGAGVEAARAALADDPRAIRLEAAESALAGFTSAAHARALRLAWSAGVLAFVALALLAALAQGAGRVGRPAAAVLLAALPGTVASWWLLQASERAQGAALPSGARADGLFAEAGGVATYLLAILPGGTVLDVWTVHVVLSALGGALLVIAGITWLAGSVRPRRRGYL